MHVKSQVTFGIALCFLLVQVIRASGLVKVAGNNLAGSVKLNDFTMTLKWSNIGNLRLYLVQVLLNIAITQNKILFCMFINKKFQYRPVAACDVDSYSNGFLAICKLTPCTRFSFASHSWFHPSQC